MSHTTFWQPLLLLLTGLVLGMRHAFDRDHVAAVTHFISLEPDPVRSAWFGCRWAIGHALTVLALGSLILLLHLKFDPSFERYAELAVGVTLIILGVWRLLLLVQERRHVHINFASRNLSTRQTASTKEKRQQEPRVSTRGRILGRHRRRFIKYHACQGVVFYAHHQKAHSHLHTHEPGREHVHRFAPTLVGMVHGASGTAEVFVLLPIALISTTWLAYLYIGLFSLGCAATMSGYGYVVGRFYRRANATGQRIYRTLVVLTSLSGLVLGVVWIAKNL